MYLDFYVERITKKLSLAKSGNKAKVHLHRFDKVSFKQRLDFYTTARHKQAGEYKKINRKVWLK